MSVPSQLCILVAGMRTRKHWEGSAREACDRQHRALWAYRALRDGFFWGGSLWKPWGVSLQEPRGSILASSHTVRTKAQRQEGAWCDPRMGGKPVEAGPGGREGTQQEGPQSNGEKGGRPDSQKADRPALAGGRRPTAWTFYISVFHSVHRRRATEIYKPFWVYSGLIYQKSEIPSERNTQVVHNLSERTNISEMRVVSQNTQYEQIIFMCNLEEMIISFSRKLSKYQYWNAHFWGN